MDIPHDFTGITDEALLNSLIATAATSGKVNSHAAVRGEVLRRMRDGRERGLTAKELRDRLGLPAEVPSAAACLRTDEGYGME